MLVAASAAFFLPAWCLFLNFLQFRHAASFSSPPPFAEIFPVSLATQSVNSPITSRPSPDPDRNSKHGRQ